jgi:hypothetical protein|tara:strand:- start:382 stop:540 length:159 start_codon:yes stop_codon:yes gene_type:complete
MFYTFNSFWYGLITLLTTWVSYGIFGYEFCVITLLALIYLKRDKNEDRDNTL